MPRRIRPSQAILGGAILIGALISGNQLLSESRAPSPPEEQQPTGVTEKEGRRDAELRALAGDAEVVKRAAEQYQMMCSACHAAADIGGDAPSNLFDSVWHHGGRPSEIEQTIINGYLDAGMPPWHGMISDDEIAALVAYLLSVQN